MTPLDEIERLAKQAKDAIPGVWQRGASHDEDPSTVYAWPQSGSPQSIADCFRVSIAAFIAACDPQTVLALVRVVRAAVEWRRGELAYPEENVPCGDDALRDAIDALTPTNRTGRPAGDVGFPCTKNLATGEWSSEGTCVMTDSAVQMAREFLDLNPASTGIVHDLARAVLDLSADRDRLRDALREALDGWGVWCDSARGYPAESFQRIAALRKLLEGE